MDPFRLLIPPAVVDAVVAHARAELPNECCGFLAGPVADGVGRVTLHLPLVNEAASPTAFSLGNDRGVFDAFRAIRLAGAELLALYHSHPTSAAVPSRTDVERNTYGPAVAWLIVGLAGDAPDVRAWWLSDTGYREAGWAAG